MAGKQKKFTEQVSAGNGIRINREAGVISQVRILGAVSANNRRYLPEAMQQAATMYEMAPVYVDHAPGTGDGERSFRDLAGELRNVSFNPVANEVRGDLHVLMESPHAAAIFEVAEKMPSRLGLSHVAMGVGENQGDVWVCDEIKQVLSVDLVTRPATNSSLFESVEFGPAADPDDGKAVDPLTGEPVEIPDPHEAMDNLDSLDVDENGEVFLTSLQRSFRDAIVAIATNPRLSLDQKKQQVGAMLDVFDAVDPNAIPDAPAEESFRRGRPAGPAAGRRYRGLQPLTEAGASIGHSQQPQPQQPGNYPAGGLAKGLKLASDPEAGKRLADALKM